MPKLVIKGEAVEEEPPVEVSLRGGLSENVVRVVLSRGANVQVVAELVNSDDGLRIGMPRLDRVTAAALGIVLDAALCRIKAIYPLS